MAHNPFASFDELSQPWDLWMALIKAACFGFLAGTVACYKGLYTKGGPKGVGDAVNQAVLWRLQPGRWEGPHRIPQRNGCWNRLEPADPGWAATVVDAVPGDGTAP